MKLTVGQILEKKGKNVWSVASQATVYEALGLLAEKEIGAVVVMDGGKIAGIFSERDYARKVILKGRFSKDTLVSEIMSRSVCYVTPGATLDECMALMTARRVRHLPVLRDEAVAGMISIGDVVKEIISEQKFEIHELEGYVDDVLKTRKR